jgi:hypothetical protein
MMTCEQALHFCGCDYGRVKAAAAAAAACTLSFAGSTVIRGCNSTAEVWAQQLVLH